MLRTERTPADSIDAYNDRLADQAIDAMPDDLREDAGYYADLQRSIHTGTDRHGRRLSEHEKQSLKSQLNDHKRQMAQRYAGGSEEALNELLVNKGFSNRAIKRQLLSRYRGD